MKILVRFLGTVLAVLLAAYVVPGFVITGFYTALIVALILGILNITIKPLLLILTLPLNVITLGLFTFVINAVLLWFIASFVDGFQATFVAALLGGIVIAVVNWGVHKL